jgi:hypothetical protein
MGQVIALVKTLVGAVLPAVLSFVGQHAVGIGVCIATICFCMFLGVQAAIIIAIVSLVVAVLCQKDTMQAVKQYYEDEIERQTRDKNNNNRG